MLEILYVLNFRCRSKWTYHNKKLHAEGFGYHLQVGYDPKNQHIF